MNRRGFLKGLASVPVIPFIQNPVISAINGLVTEPFVQIVTGYEPNAAELLSGGASGVVTNGNFSKALWPGIDKWYADAYSNYPDERIFK